MKFATLFLALCLLFCLRSLGQQGYFVKGTVADTALKSKLINTSICVLNAKDSILVAFTRAAADGTFTIGNLAKGKYLLLVTYPAYADYVAHFNLDSVHKSHDFGTLNMIQKSVLLADVIIKAKRAAIKIKGDTTEFTAENFVVQPNAKVEDLLKQLPGITVDQNGKITAQGQTVSKVLVDGEEFFGDDPTLVTKNIRADMVDKVQLYDKKSDQATFTGIDDGQKTKTINIKLKEDKKNGYFGKVEADGGTDGYYQGQLLFNAFKAKQKFSAYGILGNTGKVGLGWQDSQKYGTSNLEFGDGGEIFISGGGDGLDSFDGQYSGEGIPVARTGGLHYDDKWNGDKQSINTNYKAGYLGVSGTSDNLTQNNTPTSILYTNANQTFNNSIFRQKLDGTYKIKLDTTSDLKIAVDGTTKNTTTRTNYNTTETDGDHRTLNTDNRNVINNEHGKIFDASALYTKKFKKKGRTLSVLVSEAINQSTGDGFLKSTIIIPDTMMGKQDTSIINQRKTSELKSAVLNTNFTYTEPFTKALSLIVNYGFGLTNSTSNLTSFNQSAPGNYNIIVDSLSNAYKLKETSNLVGAIFNYKKGKGNLNFGTKVSDVAFNQLNEFDGSALKRNFINWNPQASFQYRFTQQQSVYLSYNGSTTQPTIQQIQPVLVNTDPLNIVLGNPLLTPSFTNRINFYYQSYKVISGQSIWINGGYTFITNPIVSNLMTDTTTGKTTSQYINLGNKRSANFYFNAYYNRKLSGPDLNVGLNLSANGNDSYNETNGELNFTKSYTYNANLQVGKYKEKKYDMNLEFGPTYTISGSSIQPEINNNGAGFNGDYNLNFYLPGKFQISSDGNYQFRAKTETFNTDFHRTIINASLIKSFLKEGKLKVGITGNDLLNQNVGFSRTANGNYLTQNTYTTIKRYFMLTLVYDFNKVGGGVPQK